MRRGLALFVCVLLSCSSNSSFPDTGGSGGTSGEGGTSGSSGTSGSAGAGGTEQVCEPGAVEACGCVSGSTSQRECLPSGLDWGDCDCSAAGSSGASGTGGTAGSGGTGGSGGSSGSSGSSGSAGTNGAGAGGVSGSSGSSGAAGAGATGGTTSCEPRESPSSTTDTCIVFNADQSSAVCSEQCGDPPNGFLCSNSGESLAPSSSCVVHMHSATSTITYTYACCP
ncbi:MAG: hypothetical protein U0165_03540 [Polyangiaceae bacterium]